MRTFTTDEKIVNLILAAWRWSEIDPNLVNLESWKGRNKCGTTGCFGGWLVTWPEFQEMGVMGAQHRTRTCEITDRPAEPCVAGSVGFPFSVARELFGNADLFEVAHNAPEDDDMDMESTDYELVVNRIEAQYADLVDSLGDQP